MEISVFEITGHISIHHSRDHSFKLNFLNFSIATFWLILLDFIEFAVQGFENIE